MSFGGKSAVITGGAAGIGRAAAEMLARQGASVIIADIDQALGEEAAAAIRAEGGQAHFIRCDIGDEEYVKAMVGLAVEKFGKLDLAFNNAGIAPPISKLATNRKTTKLSEAIPNTAAINNAPLICAAFSLCFADKYAPLKSIPPPCLALRAIATRRTLHG